jgi:hypothetical protein
VCGYLKAKSKNKHFKKYAVFITLIISLVLFVHGVAVVAGAVPSLNEVASTPSMVIQVFNMDTRYPVGSVTVYLFAGRDGGIESSSNADFSVTTGNEGFAKFYSIPDGFYRVGVGKKDNLVAYQDFYEKNSLTVPVEWSSVYSAWGSATSPKGNQAYFFPLKTEIVIPVPTVTPTPTTPPVLPTLDSSVYAEFAVSAISLAASLVLWKKA